MENKETYKEIIHHHNHTSNMSGNKKLMNTSMDKSKLQNNDSGEIKKKQYGLQTIQISDEQEKKTDGHYKNKSNSINTKIITLDENINNTLNLTPLQTILSGSQPVINAEIINDYSNKNEDEGEISTVQPDSNNTKYKSTGHSWVDKNPKHCQMYYQNINSLKPQNMAKWKDTLERMKYLNLDIAGMSKHALLGTKTTNWQNMKRTLSR
jgi:hypothetical protein